LLTNPRLLDVAESIVGPEVYSNPVQHIRMKLPKRALAADIGADNLVVQTPWHQDNGVILPEADEASILTIWLPLNDATIENGCMQVLPGSHRTGLEDHCPVDGEISIPKKLLDLQQAVTLPMKAGSVLLMHQHTAHASLANQTYDTVRLSFDLRYQPVGQPTGRPAFPGFVARSAAQPESVLRDPDVWKQLWLDTRARLAPAEDPVYNRWDGSAAVCA
jgi:ectoine hydroxylase-related dioxygenase (phytanoyl-CoA dioxygenase family)